MQYCRDYEWISRSVLVHMDAPVVVFHLETFLLSLAEVCWCSLSNMSIIFRLSHHVLPSLRTQRLWRLATSVTFYKNSARSPHRVSLNKRSVDMNNMPFKRPTIVDASPLSDRLRTLIGYCPPGPPSRDHPLCALIGQTLVSAMLNLIDWFRGGAPIKEEPTAWCFPLTESGCQAASAKPTWTTDDVAVE